MSEASAVVFVIDDEVDAQSLATPLGHAQRSWQLESWDLRRAWRPRWG